MRLERSRPPAGAWREVVEPWLLDGCSCDPSCRSQAQGRSPFQMAFMECAEVVQPVASAASDPALRRAILPGTGEGRANRIDTRTWHRDRRAETWERKQGELPAIAGRYTGLWGDW